MPKKTCPKCKKVIVNLLAVSRAGVRLEKPYWACRCK